jgi:pimeloyl-ACP methyl ester carboxylesterase
MREQSRARRPGTTGYVSRDGVRIHYEVYGDAGPTVLFVPPWSLVHSRVWKLQVPYLARRFRVVVFDPRGNGKSDRPVDRAAYAETEYAADTLAVMDASGTDEAVVVTLSIGAQRSLLLAAEHPDRVRGVVFLGPTLPLAPAHPHRHFLFDEVLPTDDGWAKYNAHYWRRDYQGFVEFFIGQCAPEPHSTKLVEDGVGWGLEVDAETLIETNLAADLDEAAVRELAGRVRCPVLVIHGDQDAISPGAAGRELAIATGGELVVVEGGGHLLHARDPVKVNLLLRDFVERANATRPRLADA